MRKPNSINRDLNDVLHILAMLVPPTLCPQCLELGENTGLLNLFEDAVVILHLCPDCGEVYTVDMPRRSRSDHFGVNASALNLNSATALYDPIRNDPNVAERIKEAMRYTMIKLQSGL